MLCTAPATALPAQTYTRLYSFDGPDGKSPAAALTQGADGHLYGTTLTGGLDGANCMLGCGTIFKTTPGAAGTTLYKFCSEIGCADGFAPGASLAQATNGDFYGTTEYGGANAGPDGDGAGTIFKITPNGTLTTLYSLCSQSGCTDGQTPYAGLVQAANGDF